MDKKDFDRLVKSVKQMKLIQAGKMKPSRVHYAEALTCKIKRERIKKPRSLLAAAYTKVAKEDRLVEKDWSAA